MSEHCEHERAWLNALQRQRDLTDERDAARREMDRAKEDVRALQQKVLGLQRDLLRYHREQQDRRMLGLPER